MDVRRSLFGAIAMIAVGGAVAATPVLGQAAAADQAVRAGGVFTSGPDSYRIDLLVDGDAAAIRVRRQRDGVEQLLRVTEPTSALLILADRRLAFLWTALTDWAGPSLDKLRARTLADARRRWSQGWSAEPQTLTESSVRPQTRALLQYTRVLWTLGLRDEANTMLRAALTANPLRSEWQRSEYAMVTIRLANQLFHAGDAPAADALYATMERVLGGSGFAVNATINRAYLAVEQGRHADGLRLIDAAFAAFTGTSAPTKGKRADVIPGSLREFAWIKACALHGLGRPEDAAALMGPVMADREPRDDQFILTPNENLRMRAFMCMHDADAVAREMVGRIERATFSPGELVQLQPGFHRPDWNPATLAVVRADPRVQAALVGKMRVLPPELGPALNGWEAAR